MESRKRELDNMRLRFEKLEPWVILRPELESTLGQVQLAVQRLAEENIAQQFELNVLNNFVDKYHPIRVQHQLSSIFRNCFFELGSLNELFERYERHESAKFEELH
jgi:hypothetical protein